MNVGVIGVCGFGLHHAEAFEAIGCNVVAVADVAPALDAAAERFGAEPHRDYRNLIERRDLDAISVSLPPSLHPPVLRAAHARGLFVLCEKPIATTVADGEEILRDLGRDGRVMVGFSLRYHPAYRRLRAWMLEGRLGRVRTILARKCWRAGSRWRLSKGGGAVLIKDIHYYDLLPWLLDAEPTDFCAFGGATYHHGEVEDAYQLLMTFGDEVVFHLDSAWWPLPDRVNTFEVIGDQARAVITGDRLTLHDSDVHEIALEGEPTMVAEIRAFTEWVAGKGERPPGIPEAVAANRRAQRVVDLLRNGTSRQT